MTYNFYIDPIRRTVTSESMTVLWLDQDVTTIHFSVEDFEGFTFDGSSILIKAVLPDRTQVEITPENFSTEPITTEDDEGQTVITGYSTSFDWTLTLEHTKAVGLLTYSICAIMLNLDGETVDKEWHTLNDSFQIRDHIHFNGSDDQDDPVTAATNAEKIAALKAQVDGLAGGVKTTGAVSQMTDHSVAYVYTGSETGYTRGNWYYWSGTAWVSGGTYGGAVTDPTLSVAGAAADAKVVGDALAEKADADDLTAIDTRVTAVEGEIPDISVVDGRLVIDGTSYDIGGVGIASITKTGTSGLVDTYTILLSDGTSTTFTVTNGDVSDAKIQGFIEDWLEEHPEATTTVQDGSITMAKLASDVSAKLTDTDLSYKWVANGYMREHVRPFQGWAQNVVYDPDLGKAVGIINSGNASHTNAQPWYRVTIDKTGYMSPYEEVVVYDTDGVTPYVPAKGYMGCTCRLSDGSYMCVDGSQIIYKSTDKLKTLVKQRTYNFTSNSDGSMFTLTELSNGRLILGHGGWVNGFWYSDDDGVTWTNVVPSASGLGNMIYPERQHTPFEPCFIEIGSGKVLAVARKSMNAQASATRGYAVKEPAVYSVSEDYGATWSAWANSTVITDMTACNGKAVIIGDKVHFVYGSRYGNTQAGQNFQLFYTYASLADAYEDKWATPVVIDHGHWDASTATNPHDSGYPSVWADENANLYSVYYDGDGTGSAFGANWRLCTGSPVAKLPALNADGGGSYNVGYTQKAVDKKMSLIWAKINEILLLIGQMPDDSGDYDGTSPIFDGLVAWYDVTNASKWNAAALASMIGESTAYSTNASQTYLKKKDDSPTVFDNGFADNVAALFVQSTIGAIIGSASTFTVEFVDYIKTNQVIFAVKASTAYGNTSANPSVFTRNNNFGEYKSNIHHLVGVFSSGSVSWYVDGAHIADESTEVSFSDIVAGYLLFVAPGTDGKMGDVRIYDRALTADEIRNNYLYTQSETDYLTAPTFS